MCLPSPKSQESAGNEKDISLADDPQQVEIFSFFALEENPQIENIAIGVFDGLHLGHQKILERLLSLGTAESCLVLSFDRHPLAVISPEQAPPSLLSLSQKKNLLHLYGIKHILFVQFDQRLRQLRAEPFLITLKKIFPRLRAIVVGEDFRFGLNAEGNVAFLKERERNLRVQTVVVPPLIRYGEPISSTRIRKAIVQRNIWLASELLGRSYRIEGYVAAGRGAGKEIGFPTANLEGIAQLLPPPGVYGCQVEYKNEIFFGVANYGRRPTVQEGGELVLEVHLLNFSGNLYGEKLSLFNIQFLREEKKFLSLPELKSQIEKDIQKAKEFFMPKFF
ncbi:bifunctional riboflavin kinase/FAD synthetase [Candidatus Methylacidiphilum infernorum]|uniref:Riboflavin biosynthesis protein n=1 Tax=Candidatus Methylacidiphilum infernorum TaxID=511746 RepID=A0ABX7PY81_9BACT|nr:bifunctional riboflavin kinase/FAD synthetase [Candidatus Methylacidiphilum infernorum]QSR87549.1 bifunctional riboflavin kinase/FAD synthetase [Candidatus Methylacidiphilum infernorum]